jgi:hypothetical protein
MAHVDTMLVNTMLNVAWAAVCLATFAWFIRFERRRNSGLGRALTYRAVAVSLALVSLFPCVSATDDSVRMQFFGATSVPADHQNRPHQKSQGSQPDQKSLGTLVRLLEALETVQITVSLVLSVILCLFALAYIETHRSLDRFLPTRGGRAPPALV